MTGIYCITCTVTNEKYVGQSVGIKRRIATHKRELKNNCHYNKHLQATYNKYGSENFVYEILEQCSKDQLNERERFYIQLFDSYLHGFNQSIGGSDINGEHNPMYGKSGVESPRFKDYILKLDFNGNIVGRYESTCQAAQEQSEKANPSGILKCLYTWQGKNYDNTFCYSYHQHQWIYESDYYKLLPYCDFSQKRTRSNLITTKMIDEGALDSDIH